MGDVARLAVIDLAAPDRASTAKSIRKAFIEYGFCYVIGHGIGEELMDKAFQESRKFFSLPMNQKNLLLRKNHRGYTPPFSENLDPLVSPIGDWKEGFNVGPLDAEVLNRWPSPEVLPDWEATISAYYKAVMLIAKKVVSMIALALDLEEEYFEKLGALDHPQAILRLLYYPDVHEDYREENIAAGAHSDYGLITLLATDGVQGLQVCRNKDSQPRIWEDVPHLQGAFIVNVGDLMERWTNGLFPSTLHRVIRVGSDRYSIAFFLESDPDCIVECIDTCCSPLNPKRYPPIRGGDYLKERLSVSYGK